jgi:hypothetical protein
VVVSVICKNLDCWILKKMMMNDEVLEKSAGKEVSSSDDR